MALQRKPGREHIPNYPRGWITIRFLQLFLAVAILGLAAYTVYATRAAAASNGLGLFTVCHHSTGLKNTIYRSCKI
jgi:hypothetical protein